MPLYCCERCNYTTNYKNNLRAHLRRASVCAPGLAEPSVEALLLKLNLPKEPHLLRCSHCSITFSSAARLDYHTSRNICRQAFTQSPTNTIINNIQHNNSIHIHLHQHGIRDFGNEDLSHISDELKKHCLLSGIPGVAQLVKAIHFNHEAPHNHNLFLKSSKQKTFFVMKDGLFRDTEKSNCIPSLLNNSYSILQRFFEANKDIDLCLGSKREDIYAFFIQHICSHHTVRYYRLIDAIVQVVKDNTTTSQQLICKQLAAPFTQNMQVPLPPISM